MNKFMLLLILSMSASATENIPPKSSIRTQEVNDICTTKTSTIRNVPNSLKKEVYKRAGIAFGDRILCAKGYEVDHIISLQLGGTNDISNLQLQAYCTKDQLPPTFPKGVLYDARAKDSMETHLHTDICHGRITPEQAQIKIYNWKN